jgi:hypothetical protein
MHSAVAQSRYLMEQAESVLRGLDDSHIATQPHPGTKTAGWLIGHLAVSGDFGRRLCQRTPICPVAWRAAFNPGTQPSTDPNAYPTLSELSTAFRSVYSDLGAAALEMEPEALAAVNPFAPGRAGFPTSGEFVAYLLTGHLAYHLGQLVAWRAAAGLVPREQPDVVTA